MSAEHHGGGESISQIVEAAAVAKQTLGIIAEMGIGVFLAVLLPGTTSPAEASGGGGGGH